MLHRLIACLSTSCLAFAVLPGCHTQVAGPLTVGGEVAGLNGSVRLQMNETDELTVSVDGAFRFNRVLAPHERFIVTVADKPPGQDCRVSHGEGTMSTKAITTVDVICILRPVKVSLTDDPAASVAMP